MNNPLTDVVPPKFRKYLYAVLFLGSLIYVGLEVSGGDWGKALEYAFIALVGGTAHANTDVPSGKHAERGAADIGLGLLIAIFVGVVLLLFKVHF